MKKFLLSIACFVVAVIAADQFYGLCCNYLNDHPKRGETFYRNYIVNESDDDMVMFGSSRMVHHYVSDILADSLGMTVWNAGVDGMGIIMNYGYLELLLRHHTPKVILYDLSPYDFCIEDNVKQLRNLRPYARVKEIGDIIKSVNSLELIKLHSRLFMYNSSLLPLLRDYYKPGGKRKDNGYRALSGVMDETMIKDEETIPDFDLRIDEIKIDMLEKFVSKCENEGIQLLFLVSPEFCTQQTVLPDKVEDLVKDRALFFNYSYVEGISNDKTMFKDLEHLNNDGAVLFTRLLSERLKSVIVS